MIKLFLKSNFIVSLLMATVCINCCFAGEETERPYDFRPYRVQVLFFQDNASEKQDANQGNPDERNEFYRTLRNRLASLIGNFWQLEFSEKKAADWQDYSSILNDSTTSVPENWKPFDKIFFVFSEQPSSLASGHKIRVRQFDLITRYSGREKEYSVDDQAKVVDFLIQAFFEQFFPIARLEHSSNHTASLRIRGEHLFRFNNFLKAESGPIPAEGDVLLPFVRSLDSAGNPIDVSRIDWTILVAETVDPQTGLLQCRIESGQRDPLGRRRRGRTEIYAISVPTPVQPTLIRLQARSDGPSNFLPRCDVFETVPGKDKPILIGQSDLNGLFLLNAESTRSFRVCQFRSGRALIAQFPVVRGLDEELLVPVSDDPIRLEAEAAIIRIQEEVIDIKARRSILEKRLEKAQKDDKGDTDKAVREIRAELSQLKDDERFLLELRQAQMRFRSEDPLVQRRIDRMFRTTEKTIKQYSADKSLVPVGPVQEQ